MALSELPLTLGPAKLSRFPRHRLCRKTPIVGNTRPPQPTPGSPTCRKKITVMNLRAITDAIGKEVEKWDYETLSRPAEQIVVSERLHPLTAQDRSL